MTTAKCPICGKPTAPEQRPFCSPRCADVDLHRWLAGSYTLTGSSDPDEAAPDEDGD